jgi:hypothetical protein
MEKPHSFESKESAPITPESVQAEIRSRFSDSRELYNYVKKMVDDNHAMRMGKPKTSYEAADAVLHRLASYRRRGVQPDGMPIEQLQDEEVGQEDVEKAFKAGALLGLLTASVYHGEATFIDGEGEVSSDPINM